MAEVLDIIHKLTYEANTDVITALNKEFGTQFKQIQSSEQALKGYQAQLDKTLDNEIKKRQVLQGLIDREKSKIENVTAAIGKQFAENQKLNTSLIQTSRNLSSLSLAGSQLLREAPAFTYSLQTGILALSNNIPILLDELNKAKAAGSSTKEIFSALGSSVFGITGIVTIATSVLAIFGDELFETGNDADKTAENIDKVTDSIDKLIKKDAEYSRRLGAGVGQGLGALERELKLLQAQGASDDKILAKEKEISAERQKGIQQQIDLYDNLRKAVIGGKSPQQILEDPTINIPSLYKEEFIDEIAKAQEEGIDLTETFTNKIIDLNEELANEVNSIQVKQKTQERKNREETKRERERRLAEEKRERDRILREREEETKHIEKMRTERSPFAFDLSRLPSNVFGRPVPNVPDFDKQQKREEDRLRKSREAIVNSARTVRDTLIGFIEDVYNRQIQALDSEIDIRRERVNQAVELAKRGNTEILAEETKRLDDAQAKRQEVAEKQLAINALLQASQSALVAVEALKVVTNAGATGDPYSTAARIAAAVAALAAGFAFVTNLVNASRGFADGGYTGEGGKHEVAGVVHKDEFVITKEKTAKFRPLLEAIHTGKIKDLSSLGYGTYASRMELAGVEGKLDLLIAATSANKTHVNTRIDESGVHQIVTRQNKLNHTRFRG